jgi:type 1 glutamine amidotransferase
VIVCTVTTGFRHSSIPDAEKTLQKLAESSGAFTIVDFAQQPSAQLVKKPSAPKKPGDLKPDADQKAKAKYESDLKRFNEEQRKFDEAMAKWTAADDEKAKRSQADWDSQMKSSMEKLSPASLAAKRIDGVIFANTTGNLPLPNREGFIRWIEAGHAFMGMHSASDTFHEFQGYIDMLQGEFAGHQAQVPADLIAADREHPANAGIGANWNIKQEEMYLIKSQDRAKVRSLWYLNHHPNEAANAGFFPVSWCRMAGKGKVFYTSLGHREDLWSDDPNLKDRKNPVEISKQYQAHILGGIKWALGLVEGSATPNPEVK